MKILSAKLGCIGQAVSGKLRVTNTAVSKVRRCFLGTFLFTHHNDIVTKLDKESTECQKGPI